MKSTARIIERAANTPLKKTLPLLLVCAIIVACVGTAGCGETAAEKTTEQTGYFNTQRVNFKKVEHADGTREESVQAAGGSWDKKFDKNGLLIWEKWQYPDDGPAGEKTYNRPIRDANPGIDQGKLLINYHMNPTQTSSLPKGKTTPADELGVDENDTIDTPAAAQGGHSHPEGWLALVSRI